ncbi:MAG: phage shock protein PspA [Deltaproteobacteria bacterium]|nr:phage shock protein PspA [Deltaproteobacteria bacterium]
MGIFSRARDIVSSNINAMLDRAENPEKLIKLMIQEMEDTLIEVKASCAGAMADQKRLRRQLNEVQAKAGQWAKRAELAVGKGREDLAREALLEKRRLSDRVARFEQELSQAELLIEEYQADIMQLEEKLASVRDRERVLIQRHVHAQRKRRAQEEIRRADTADALARFEHFENRVERMESEADLVNFGRRPNLEEEFDRLADDEGIEQELEALKAAAAKDKKGQAEPEA